ncbi:MAG: cation transporter [Candidatus Riflebacteria bacterium]|nr:cation transporter [Candidatus Riflebacteria bacterium]
MVHQHEHAPPDFGRIFALGVALNVGFVLIEAGYGLRANSLALLADAGHNLGDVLGLLLAWAAHGVSRRPSTAKHTYGLRRSSILAALFNSLLLFLAIGGIAWEAIGRLLSPTPVAGWTVIIVAAIGIGINGLTAWLFASGRKDDLNVRGAFLHMVADAVVSLGVVVAGLAILYSGKLWIDPLVSLVVIVVIAVGTWGLFRESLHLSLDGVPDGIDLEAVTAFLNALPGVIRIHDLHIWGMSTTEAVLTVHLVRQDTATDELFLPDIAADLHHRFGIEHATIQIERLVEASACSLGSGHCC